MIYLIEDNTEMKSCPAKVAGRPGGSLLCAGEKAFLAKEENKL